MSKVSEPSHQILKGIAVSGGVAKGKVCVWGDLPAVPRRSIAPEDVEGELDRLDKAIAGVKAQLEQTRRKVERELGKEEAAIFLAHLMMLEDAHFYAQIERKLTSEYVNVEMAIERALEEFVQGFEASDDPYLRERADEVWDMGRQLLEHLLSYQRQCLLDEEESVVIAARELIPSLVASLERGRIGAFITEKGGLTSHASVLARGMGIPAVVGIPELLKHVELGSPVIVDGIEGVVHIHPTAEIVREYERLEEELRVHKEARQELIGLKSETVDGERVVLQANIGKGADVASALLYKAEGVGLYRTEFHFMVRQDFPDEEEQYEIYRQVVAEMAPHPVSIRTLDLGGEKYLPYLPAMQEANPYLGWRAIRVSLSHPEALKAQLKAILRAGTAGRARILFPMIATMENVRAVRMILEEAKSELRASGKAFDSEIPVGAMIEVPSAALLADLLIQEVDFLSIGTNDLIQFTLAVDRSNEKVSQYYEPLSPALLRLLRNVIEAAKAANKEVCLCGEMAGEPQYVELLLGLGLRCFSMSPVLIPDVKEVIRSTTVVRAEELAQRALACFTAEGVRAALESPLY